MKKCFLFTCIIHPAWWVLVHCGLYDNVLRERERASSHEQIPAALERENPIRGGRQQPLQSSSFGESFNCSKVVRLSHVQQQQHISLSSPLLSSLAGCM